MSNPVTVSGSALAVTDTDVTRAEGIVSKIVQLIRNGSTGASTAGDNADPTLLPTPQPNPTTTTPLVLSTKSEQRLFRQLAIALVKLLINVDEVSTTAGADKIPRMKGDGTWDASWGFGGGSSFTFSDNETPSGAIDGANTTFTLAHTPSPGASLKLFQNGVLLRYGTDYTLTTATITMMTAPSVGEWILAYYRY